MGVALKSHAARLQEHDSEKRAAVFRKDHAQIKDKAG
jgi:hypothetical protein